MVQDAAQKALTAQRQKQARAFKRVETCRRELGRKKAVKEDGGSGSMADLAHIDNEIMFRQLQDASKTMLQAGSLLLLGPLVPQILQGQFLDCIFQRAPAFNKWQCFAAACKHIKGLMKIMRKSKAVSV